MKPKILLSLVAALVVLGLIALMVSRMGGRSKPETAQLRGTSLLEGWPINDVRSIHVKSPEDEVTLVKKENQWAVAERDGFPADPARVQSLLVKLWETPVVQAFEAGPTQNARLKLVEPAAEGDEESMATKVTFQGADDAVIGSVLIGKDNPPESMGMGADPMAGGGKTGRFIRTSKDEKIVLEVADNFSETLSSGWPYGFSAIEAEPGTWLNKSDFIKVSKIQSIAVNYKGDEKESYGLTRESDTGDFTLEGEIPEGKVLDGSKVSSLKTILQSASFEDLLTEEKVQQIDESKTVEAVIKTSEGFTYTLTLGEKDEEDNQIPVKFTVTGDFPTEREVEEGKEETEEEKTEADDAFAAKLKENQEKLEREKALESHWFALSSYRVDSLLKSRPDLLKDEEEEETTDVGELPSSIARPSELPPGITIDDAGTSSPDSEPEFEVVSEPVPVPPLDPEGSSATTPPIAIPPRPTTPDEQQETPAEEEEPPAEEEETPAEEEETPAEEEETPAEEEEAPAEEEEAPDEEEAEEEAPDEEEETDDEEDPGV